MMTPAKANLAYDFSLFEAKQDREDREYREDRENKIKAVEEPARAKEAPKTVVRPASAARWTAVSLFIVLSIVVIIMCDVQLNLLSDEISKAQTKLGTSQSEQVRLNVELESRTSLNNVEAYAVNKGLQKSSQYQITYIHLTNKDKVDIAPKSGNIFTRLINSILEYL
jgi:hypothetical protein